MDLLIRQLLKRDCVCLGNFSRLRDAIEDVVKDEPNLDYQVATLLWLGNGDGGECHSLLEFVKKLYRARLVRQGRLPRNDKTVLGEALEILLKIRISDNLKLEIEQKSDDLLRLCFSLLQYCFTEVELLIQVLAPFNFLSETLKDILTRVRDFSSGERKEKLTMRICYNLFASFVWSKLPSDSKYRTTSLPHLTNLLLHSPQEVNSNSYVYEKMILAVEYIFCNADGLQKEREVARSIYESVENRLLSTVNHLVPHFKTTVNALQFISRNFELIFEKYRFPSFSQNSEALFNCLMKYATFSAAGIKKSFQGLIFEIRSVALDILQRWQHVAVDTNVDICSCSRDISLAIIEHANDIILSEDSLEMKSLACSLFSIISVSSLSVLSDKQEGIHLEDATKTVLWKLIVARANGDTDIETLRDRSLLHCLLFYMRIMVLHSSSRNFTDVSDGADFCQRRREDLLLLFSQVIPSCLTISAEQSIWNEIGEAAGILYKSHQRFILTNHLAIFLHSTGSACSKKHDSVISYFNALTRTVGNEFAHASEKVIVNNLKSIMISRSVDPAEAMALLTLSLQLGSVLSDRLRSVWIACFLKVLERTHSSDFSIEPLVDSIVKMNDSLKNELLLAVANRMSKIAGTEAAHCSRIVIWLLRPLEDEQLFEVISISGVIEKLSRYCCLDDLHFILLTLKRARDSRGSCLSLMERVHGILIERLSMNGETNFESRILTEEEQTVIRCRILDVLPGNLLQNYHIKYEMPTSFHFELKGFPDLYIDSSAVKCPKIRRSLFKMALSQMREEFKQKKASKWTLADADKRAICAIVAAIRYTDSSIVKEVSELLVAIASDIRLHSMQVLQLLVGLECLLLLGMIPTALFIGIIDIIFVEEGHVPHPEKFRINMSECREGYLHHLIDLRHKSEEDFLIVFHYLRSFLARSEQTFEVLEIIEMARCLRPSDVLMEADRFDFNKIVHFRLDDWMNCGNSELLHVITQLPQLIETTVGDKAWLRDLLCSLPFHAETIEDIDLSPLSSVYSIWNSLYPPKFLLEACDALHVLSSCKIAIPKENEEILSFFFGSMDSPGWLMTNFTSERLGRMHKTTLLQSAARLLGASADSMYLSSFIRMLLQFYWSCRSSNDTNLIMQSQQWIQPSLLTWFKTSSSSLQIRIAKIVWDICIESYKLDQKEFGLQIGSTILHPFLRALTNANQRDLILAVAEILNECFKFCKVYPQDSSEVDLMFEKFWMTSLDLFLSRVSKTLIHNLGAKGEESDNDSLVPSSAPGVLDFELPSIFTDSNVKSGLVLRCVRDSYRGTAKHDVMIITELACAATSLKATVIDKLTLNKKSPGNELEMLIPSLNSWVGLVPEKPWEIGIGFQTFHLHGGASTSTDSDFVLDADTEDLELSTKQSSAVTTDCYWRLILKMAAIFRRVFRREGEYITMLPKVEQHLMEGLNPNHIGRYMNVKLLMLTFLSRLPYHRALKVLCQPMLEAALELEKCRSQKVTKSGNIPFVTIQVVKTALHWSRMNSEFVEQALRAKVVSFLRDALNSEKPMTKGNEAIVKELLLKASDQWLVPHKPNKARNEEMEVSVSEASAYLNRIRMEMNVVCANSFNTYSRFSATVVSEDSAGETAPLIAYACQDDKEYVDEEEEHHIRLLHCSSFEIFSTLFQRLEDKDLMLEASILIAADYEEHFKRVEEICVQLLRQRRFTDYAYLAELIRLVPSTPMEIAALRHCSASAYRSTYSNASLTLFASSFSFMRTKSEPRIGISELIIRNRSDFLQYLCLKKTRNNCDSLLRDKSPLPAVLIEQLTEGKVSDAFMSWEELAARIADVFLLKGDCDENSRIVIGISIKSALNLYFKTREFLYATNSSPLPITAFSEDW